MKLAAISDRPDLDTLTAVIARSPIVVAEPARQSCRLPAGFDEVDAAILHWIAAEGRRIDRGYLAI
jgi:hypothetical protein